MTDPLTQLTAPARESMAEVVEHALSAAIRDGSLPAGYRLREVHLAKQFNCSTTPVREALRRLESQGFVTVTPRRGAVVIDMSFEDVRDLYELRMLLEPAMARRAAERASTDHPALLELRRILAEQADQVTVGEPVGGRLDAAFHEMVAKLAGNEAIAEQVGRATRQIEAVQARTGTSSPRGLEAAHGFHAKLLDLISRGEGVEAEAVMAEHLVQAQDGVEAGLRAVLGTRD